RRTAGRGGPAGLCGGRVLLRPGDRADVLLGARRARPDDRRAERADHGRADRRGSGDPGARHHPAAVAGPGRQGRAPGRLRTGIPGLEFSDPELEGAVRSGLDRVEKALRAAVSSDFPLVAETARHLVEAGGKRFRPVLTLLASHFGAEPESDQVVAASVVVEL